MKAKKIIALVLVIATFCSIASFSANAYTQKWRNVSGGGSKTYNSSKLTTGWSGQLRATNLNSWGSENLYFTGSSYSKWLGGNPYNADAITHYDILEVDGWGKPSWSGGVGADSSGPSANFGLSGVTTDKSQAFAYSVDDEWRVSVDYSYYVKIHDLSWMDLYTAATFRFGSSYKVVNSRVDNAWVSRGTIYYK